MLHMSIGMNYSSMFLSVIILLSCSSWTESANIADHDHSLVIGLTRITKYQSDQMTVDIIRATGRRSSIRFHALKKQINGSKQQHGHQLLDVSEPLGDYKDGYIMPLRLGSPPQLLQVYMDTGSDLVWVPCLPNPNDIHNSDNIYDPCTMAGCPLRAQLKGSCIWPCPGFSYTYGDGIVSGILMRDILSIHSSTDPNGQIKKEIPNFTFGCAGAALNEPIGIAGFGRGILSFPSQIGALRRGFSYCLVSFKFEDNPNVSSPLMIGDSAIPKEEGSLPHSVQYTPMLDNPIYPNYYYIGLEGITIDNTSLDLSFNFLQGFDSEGNGGMIIDSGTTYTHLPQTIYTRMVTTLQALIQYPRSQEYENRTAFGLCYQASTSAQGFPAISLHFSNNVTLNLPTENYIYAVAFGVRCLLIQSTEEGENGPAAVLGNFQQQNIHVVYDTEKMRIGFQPKDCAASAAALQLDRNNIYNSN